MPFFIVLTACWRLGAKKSNTMSNKTKMWIAIYAIWFMLNFSFIFIGDSDGTTYFFPFRHGEFDWDLDYYDFGEFCVYALFAAS